MFGLTNSDGNLRQGEDTKKKTKDTVYARSKPGLAIAVCILAVSPLLNGLLPQWVSRAALLVGMCVLALRLVTFRRWNDEIPFARRFFISFGLLLLELIIENFFTWAVSASDMQKYDGQQPLQDNGELAVLALCSRVPIFCNILIKPWMEILQLLVALILLGTSVLFDQVAFSGFGMMTRAIHTITVSRVIRTVAFMCTVIPSQRPGCFERRFPSVPSSWTQFLIIGFTKMRAMGGCNDLIISGHAIVYSVAPLAVQSYYGPGLTSSLLWAAVAYNCLRAPYTKQHYSVDMFLAVAVTALVWNWTIWAYDSRAWRKRHSDETSDPKQWGLTGLILLVLAIVSYIIIAGGA